MFSIISAKRDKSICEKFARRETDKRKKVIESDQTSLFINQDPKEVSGSRATA